MLERALTLAGHQVTAATDGRNALQILEGGTFDLVITDIVMPEMEGLELIRQIRKQSPAPKIIGMSGGGRGTADDYLELAKRFGAARTLAKPFTVKELTAAVDDVLRGT